MIPHHKKYFIWIAMPVAALVAAAGIWYLYRTQLGQSFLPPCLLYSTTGLYCTGCGVTRSLWHLVHGHVYAALRMNALFILGLPFALCFLALCLVRLLRDQPLPNLPTWVPWVILGLILSFTVLRNLPWPPFNWLAPTAVPWVRG